MQMNTSKRRYVRIALTCVSWLGLLVSAPTVLATTLKIATVSPEGSSYMTLLREAGRAVESRTDGAVKIKFYPGGVMGDDKAVLRKMRIGQLHGAVFTAGGLIQNYPDIALYNMPMVFRDNDEIDFVRQTLDARLMDGMRESGFVGFGLSEVGFAYPMTQIPATSVAQMRQLKVWTPDNDIGSLRGFEAFQIAPIPLPIADVLAGLQTGLIDSLASPPIGTIALQWHTQLQYGLDLPLLYIYGLMAMSNKAFDRLTPDVQQILKEEFGQAVRAADAASRLDHNSARAALGQQGIEWLEPSAEERAEWLQLAELACQRLIDSGYVSAQLYQEMLDLLQQYRDDSGQ